MLYAGARERSPTPPNLPISTTLLTTDPSHTPFSRPHTTILCPPQEVKGVADVIGLGKRDAQLAFRGFLEDYNTATMPHQKVRGALTLPSCPLVSVPP